MFWQKKQSAEEPLMKAVRFFRSLDFFAQDASLTEQALANKIDSLHKQQWDSVLDFTDEQADLNLLKRDDGRVWWEDMEADVCNENLVYERVLTEWSDISRGACLPLNIKEDWRSDEGPIEVRFTLNGKQKIVRPTYSDDWLDCSILLAINEWITDTGFQFEFPSTFDQTAFIVVLTGDEKRQLIKERGWIFGAAGE